MVRIWHPAGGEAESVVELGRLRGIVEHVASGRTDTFAGPDALMALLVSALEALPRPRSDQSVQSAGEDAR